MSRKKSQRTFGVSARMNIEVSTTVTASDLAEALDEAQSLHPPHFLGEGVDWIDGEKPITITGVWLHG